MACLWVVDASSELSDPRVCASIVVHATSMLTALVLIPRDVSAPLTPFSVGALATAPRMQYGPRPELHSGFCLHFISLFRIGQFPMIFVSRMRCFVRMSHIFIEFIDR
ncbi:uncharacterized protein Tco025E_04076 [Trypanosoma conorhini]|uniref:Uncharacterized protein n=1 Tax=Trypanosoma conorhini TaxID=83891 RepID=A0A3R7L4J4_9TRYP|nr:uncharacterized protein Tco025E_04076 [Trypanosoma conorhini]RNF19568.1 hypothetical protein Tco025E_04076 [Trypanosoma conorhini]